MLKPDTHVEGLQSCLEFSQLAKCLDEATQTRKKSALLLLPPSRMGYNFIGEQNGLKRHWNIGWLKLHYELFFSCLRRLLQTREGLGEFEIVIKTRHARRGFPKIPRIRLTHQVFR